MVVINFIPSDDAGKDLWAKNFSNKLPQFAAKYSIAATEVADVQTGVVNFSYWLNYKNQVEEFHRKISSFKNEMRDGIDAGTTASVLPAFPGIGTLPTAVAPGVFSRLKSLALRIKKHYSFTEADGNDLGITSTSVTSVDLNTIKPVISVRLVNNGHPEILWTKKKMTAIVLFVDRGNGYELLATDNVPNYIDQYPIEKGQTAIWKYKGIYMYKDDKVGLFSDEITVTVTGRD